MSEWDSSEWGLEKCDELLTCVRSERCSECDPSYENNLKVGRVYRAKGREVRSGAWYIPELASEPETLAPGVQRLLLFCAPHFGKFDKGEDSSEMTARIKSAAKRGADKRLPTVVPVKPETVS